MDHVTVSSQVIPSHISIKCKQLPGLHITLTKCIYLFLHCTSTITTMTYCNDSTRKLSLKSNKNNMWQLRNCSSVLRVNKDIGYRKTRLMIRNMRQLWRQSDINEDRIKPLTDTDDTDVVCYMISHYYIHTRHYAIYPRITCITIYYIPEFCWSQ